MAAGCAGRPSTPFGRSGHVAPTQFIRSCTGDRSPVTWQWDPSPEERPRLDRWCASVGPPVVAAAAAAPARIRALLVVSWNVHVGGGRISELLDRLLPADGGTGVVLLLQEAFRDGDVPPVPSGMTAPFRIHEHPRTLDIVTVARDRHLSLAYVPSMRNGSGTGVGEREDRGNAILSTEPLTDVSAVELPFGTERRVAVSAIVTPRGSARGLRVVAAHLDTRRHQRQQAERLVAALGDATPDPTIVGVDTNAFRGARSRAVQVLGRAWPRLVQCGTGRTNAWLARIDFLFTNLPASTIAGCETERNRFGSDHAPQVLRLEW